jgi:hypothetical protein
MGTKLLLSEWWGHTRVFHKWVKSIVHWDYFTASVSAMCNLIYHFDGLFSSFFYVISCWHVFNLLFSSFYLQYMIFIWFSDADDNQNVTDPLLQTTDVDSSLTQSSGMKFYTSLRVLTFKEQNNK